MTTDRELLEKAAKAADYTVKIVGEGQHAYGLLSLGQYCPLWSPLNDDGDALRLAVKLRMTVDCCGTHIEASILEPSSGYVRRVSEECYREPDPYAATRRAIVRAAAAIGGES